ncbi:MAG: ParB N-terminal domain-containing protein, partial [Alphaproteobacteria bacterium]|nr:ParB N-terminal domain-containing protein [Alphaproteobacteria bacterium]
MTDQPKIQLTKKYQVLPDMPAEQFEALKADIAERGVLVPIDVDEEGHILDGHHRYRACTELGITDFPTIVRPNMSEEDRRIFARKNNMLRRHLDRKQVRVLIADQLRDTPKWANNRIAQMMGVDSKTVKTVRSQLEATSEIPKLDKLIGADGKERPVKQKRPPAIMASNADDLQRILKSLNEDGNIEALNGFHSEQSFVT